MTPYGWIIAALIFFTNDINTVILIYILEIKNICLDNKKNSKLIPVLPMIILNWSMQKCIDNKAILHGKYILMSQHHYYVSA